MSVDAFEIKKPFLRNLLEQAREGQIQLPEFQRGWVWPESNIRSLLSSVSQGFPVGTLMMLQAGGSTRFKQRPRQGLQGHQLHVVARAPVMDGFALVWGGVVDDDIQLLPVQRWRRLLRKSRNSLERW